MLADELIAARYQMAVSLGFHIVLSCIGVAFPAMIFVVHRRWLRTGDETSKSLAKRWSKVSAVLFAVGAVSGTILSFEMGLLWPGLMGKYGDVIGLPFALEGIAFFIEAVFIGIYLYGWNRLSPRIHLYTLIPIMITGVFGTFCIVSVNAWMNAPSGFTLAADGTVTNVSPLAAMFNNAVAGQSVHMLLGAYMVTGFGVASVYAVGMLRGRRDHRHRIGLLVPLAFAAVAALIQPVVGHVNGMRLAIEQPSKLAAMDLAAHTETNAPLVIGGVLIDGEVRGAIKIPGIGSLLARGWFHRPVAGLDEFAPSDRPPANVVHFSFQIMVGVGTALALFGAWFWWRMRRHRRGAADPLDNLWVLRAAAIAGPLALVALEAGWTTTEVGRQPWIVYRILRVRDAVTHNSGIWVTVSVLITVYVVLGIVAVRVLQSMASRWRHGSPEDLPTPYGPGSPQ